MSYGLIYLDTFNDTKDLVFTSDFYYECIREASDLHLVNFDVVRLTPDVLSELNYGRDSE